MTRTWTMTEDERKQLTWTSNDGRARVMVVRAEGGWRVELHEDGQWIGSEPVSPYRSGAAAIARRWVRVFSRPVEV